MLQQIKFDHSDNKEFIKELRSRVNAYFTQNKKNKHANGVMILRAIFCFTLWIGSYALLLLGNFSTGVNFAIWALMGVSMVWVTINVGHDAIHGAYSGKKWVNKLMSHTFNLNGASAYMWAKMHNVAHHTYTNVHGYDEDIESVPILRLSPETERKGYHKYQYLYSFPLYGLATISWVFIKDYVKFFKNDVGNYDNSKHPAKEYFYLFFYKACYYTLYIALPLIVLDQAWWMTLLGFGLMHYIGGTYLAIVFMLAHVVEHTHFPMPNQKGTIENSWAVHQLYTTADFAAKSWLAGFLTGGLNTQVEHHLFPNICSIHYRHLSPILEQTAKEYGVPYINYKSFGSALKSHINFLKKIGSQENYAPAPTIVTIPKKTPEMAY